MRSSPIHRSLLCAGLLALSGCGRGEGAIYLAVDANPPIRGVARLSITVTNGGQTSSPIDEVPASAPVDIPPEQHVQLRFSKDRQGPAEIAVDALDQSGALLAQGTATGQIQPSQETLLTVTLGSGTPPDAGTPPDTSTAPDLSPPPPLTWRLLNSGSTATFDTIWGTGAPGSEELLVGGSDTKKGAVLLYSKDSGATWQDTNAGGFFPSAGVVSSVSGQGEDRFAIMGGQIQYTLSGGAPLLLGPVPNLSPFLSSIMETTDGHVYAAGMAASAVGGIVAHSPDRGMTWTQAAVNDVRWMDCSGFTSIWADAGGNVFAAGTLPDIFVSNDRGSTWTARQTGLENTRLQTVWGLSLDDVYVGGFYGMVAHSTDGGQTWTQSTIPNASTVTGFWASASNDVYAIAGIVAHSRDGGRTWERQFIPSPESFNAIWGNGPRDVYIAGSNGALYRGQ